MSKENIMDGFSEIVRHPKEIDSERYRVFQNFEDEHIRRFFKKDEIVSLRRIFSAKFQSAEIFLTVKPIRFDKGEILGFLELLSICDGFTFELATDDTVTMSFAFDVFKD